MPINTVQLFIRAINAHDAAALGACMSADHRFVDAQDNRLEGRERIEAAWEEFFRLFPGYRIEIEEIFSNGPTVVVIGYAHAAANGEEERIPAAWKAQVVDNTIAEWRVYADTRPLEAAAQRGTTRRNETNGVARC